MISQEEFARQLQLSDPQTVAGAFSYFQQVKGLEAEARAQALPSRLMCSGSGKGGGPYNLVGHL